MVSVHYVYIVIILFGEKKHSYSTTPNNILVLVHKQCPDSDIGLGVSSCSGVSIVLHVWYTCTGSIGIHNAARVKMQTTTLKKSHGINVVKSLHSQSKQSMAFALAVSDFSLPQSHRSSSSQFNKFHTHPQIVFQEILVYNFKT